MVMTTLVHFSLAAASAQCTLKIMLGFFFKCILLQEYTIATRYIKDTCVSIGRYRITLCALALVTLSWMMTLLQCLAAGSAQWPAGCSARTRRSRAVEPKVIRAFSDHLSR